MRYDLKTMPFIFSRNDRSLSIIDTRTMKQHSICELLPCDKFINQFYIDVNEYKKVVELIVIEWTGKGSNV